jgi:hypothetical protein
LIEQVVKVESPVHIDEVIARLRSAWGLQRAGSRIEAVVEQGAGVALSRAREGKFLSIAGTVPILRNRGNASSSGLRRLEMIAPREIAAGVIHVVSSNLGATDDEIVVAVSRMLGFKATSAPLRKTIDSVIRDLLDNGNLRREDPMIVARSPQHP